MDTQNKNPESVGPVLGIVIIIAILVVGGIFAFTNRLSINSTQSAEEIEVSPDETTINLSTQSTSTDLTTIEADAQATDLNNLDIELEAMQKELE
jgi:hypothetical protein